MKRIGITLLMLLLTTGLVTAQVVPPINLSGELLTGGQVALSWDPPPDGLVEDFEDGEAQGFDWWVPSGNHVIEDGYAKLVTDGDWGSAAYTELSFEGDYTVEVTFEYQEGSLSRGMLFNGDGPRDNDYSGYGFWIAHTLDGYAVWKYTNGSGVAEIYWVSTPDLINEGVGASNTLTLINNAAGPVDLYLNGTWVDSIADPTYTSGYVGLVSASSNTVWYDEITCFFGAIVPDAAAVLFTGQPVAGQFNEYGLPVGQTPPAVDVQQFRQVVDTPAEREIDEFIEYRVYMDDQFIGTSDDESFTAQLTGLGEHTFQVTALYDEGESSPSNTALINWEVATLELAGTTTVVPPAGGNVVYSAHFMFNLNMTVPGVSYWTEITLPNGQVFGPLGVFPFTVTPFMEAEVFNIEQSVPGLAPPGMYTLTGNVGMMPNSMLNDSFEFEKIGTATHGGSIGFVPAQWTTRNFQPVVR